MRAHVAAIGSHLAPSDADRMIQPSVMVPWACRERSDLAAKLAA